MMNLEPSPLNGTAGRRKVAIIGLDPLTRTAAPWNDPDFEIWGLNGAHLCRDIHRDHDDKFRADLWFQIHPQETWSVGEFDWFKHTTRLGVHTVLTPADHACAMSYGETNTFRFRPYPIDKVKEQFNDAPLVNSFCLMVAYAIIQNYARIDLYGVELRAIGRELLVERPALYYWMGLAKTMGIDVRVPARSTLSNCPFVYGLEYFEEARHVAALSERLMPARWIRELRSGSNLDTVEQVIAATIDPDTLEIELKKIQEEERRDPASIGDTDLGYELLRRLRERSAVPAKP